MFTMSLTTADLAMLLCSRNAAPLARLSIIECFKFVAANPKFQIPLEQFAAPDLLVTVSPSEKFVLDLTSLLVQSTRYERSGAFCPRYRGARNGGRTCRDRFRDRGPLSQCRVRPDCVVVLPPRLDQHPRHRSVSKLSRLRVLSTKALLRENDCAYLTD